MTTATMALPPQPLAAEPASRVDRALKPYLWMLLISLFLPSELSFNFAGLEITGIKIASIILFFYILSRNLVRPHWSDLCLAAVYGSMILSVSAAGDPERAVQATGRMFLETGVPFYIARVVGQRRELLLWFMKRLILILAIMSVTVIFEAFTGRNLHQLFWSPLTGVISKVPELRLGFIRRAMAWTRHPIMLGLVYAMVVPCAILMWFEARKFNFRFGALKIALLLISVFCTVSFGTWATLTLILALFTYDRLARKWFNLPPKTRWILVGVIAVITLIILDQTTDNPLLMVLMYHLHAHQGAWLYRWNLFERVYAVMGDHWVIGYGERIPEQFQVGKVGRSIDNHYLATLLLYGQVGVYAWISVHVAALWTNIWNCWLDKRELPGADMARSYGIVILGMMLAQIFVCFFSTALTLNFMFLGFAIGQAQYIRNMRRTLAQTPGTAPASPTPNAGRSMASPRF